MKSTFVEFPQIGVVEIKQEEVSIENLRPMEVVIQNETSIISAGTELARLDGIEIGQGFPFRPGYGCVGRVIGKGEQIQDFSLGDRVFYAGQHASVQRFTHGADHQWGYLFRVPEDLDPIEAVVGCMAQIAMTAPNVTDIQLGDTVVVFGLGLVGTLAALMYQLKGARVIGVDPVSRRCELAKAAGIQQVVDGSVDHQIERILALTEGQGAKVAVDAVGHSAVVMNCVRTAAPFGEVVLLGTPRLPVTADITPMLLDVHRKGLIMRGAHMWRYPVQQQRGGGLSVAWAFNTVFEMIGSGKLNTRQLVSHVVGPYEVPAMYDGLRTKPDEHTCVIIDWAKEPMV